MSKTKNDIQFQVERNTTNIFIQYVFESVFYASFMGIMFSGMYVRLFVRPFVPLQVKVFGQGSF